MFKGFENTMRKSPQSGDDKPKDPNLHPVKSAAELLGEEKLQEYIEKLPKLVGLDNTKNAQLAKPFLDDFAEFVQELPETRSGYFSLKGGILAHCLARTRNALEMLHAYFLTDSQQQLSEAQTLWSYAIFTAGLLQGVGKLIVDLHIELYDGYGIHLSTWSPFTGPMKKRAKFYRYDFDSPYPDTFRNQASLLLARQLLPVAGFEWLASNKELFAVWLSLLHDDDAHGGRTLGFVLWRADALALSDYFEANPHLRDLTTAADFGKGGRSGSAFIQDAAPAGNAGIAFLTWLRDQIATGKIGLTAGPVVSVPGGLIITNEAFELFVLESTTFKNWQNVQTAFTGLGLHRTGLGNDIFQNYTRLHDQTPLRGILLTNKHLLLSEELAKKTTGAGYVKTPTQTPQTTMQYIATNGSLTNQAPTSDPTNNPFGMKAK